MIDATPVVIVPEQEPIPVVLADGQLPILGATVTKDMGTTLAPTTTEEHDRVTSGQRHINRLWEYTQASVAIFVTITTCAVLAGITIISVIMQVELSSNALLLVGYLVVMETSIITSYFTRTNHEKTGGVGPKASDRGYEGR